MSSWTRLSLLGRLCPLMEPTSTQKPIGERMSPGFLSPRQAADYLGISLSSLYRITKAGKVPVYRPVPDAPRLKVSDLDAFALSRREAT